MRRILLVFALPALLAACEAEQVWAPDEAVAAAAYRPANTPPSITLYTMVNNRSNEGAHSALMINASQRVVYDPAGSWSHSAAPERNDLIYGMTPDMERFYLDYHARITYRVVEQKVIVSPEVAEKAFKLAESYGAAPKAFCGHSTSDILRQLPGFEDTRRSVFPGKLMQQFSKRDDVVTKVYYDDDPDDNKSILEKQYSTGFRVETQPIQ